MIGHVIRAYQLAECLNWKGDNLRGSEVVPPYGRCSTCSGDADQGGELKVLPGELDEFEAAVPPRERVLKGVRLGGPEGRIALSLPRSMKRLKPGGTELPGGCGEVQIGGWFRLGLPLTLTEEPLEFLHR